MGLPAHGAPFRWLFLRFAAHPAECPDQDRHGSGGGVRAVGPFAGHTLCAGWDGAAMTHRWWRPANASRPVLVNTGAAGTRAAGLGRGGHRVLSCGISPPPMTWCCPAASCTSWASPIYGRCSGRAGNSRRRRARARRLGTPESLPGNLPMAQFTLLGILAEMRRAGSKYTESTIRTHVTSRMCADAPAHHGTTYDDFQRLGGGRYRLRNSPPGTDR
jgi:hypothetical protein